LEAALFGVPLLIPGLILLLAGSHWFAGATTVGWILTVLGAIPIVLMVAFVAFVKR
jgi:hypothetical protein